LELRRDLAKDVNALGLEKLQMTQASGRSPWTGCDAAFFNDGGSYHLAEVLRWNAPGVKTENPLTGYGEWVFDFEFVAIC
jgi:hypothetical protein